MSAFTLAPRSFNAEPDAPRRMAGLIWYALVETVTWLFLIGMVSTVSAGQFGSSTYTLAVAAAGIVVSFIRRGGARRLTLFTALVEFLTLALLVGVAGNPLRNGLPTVLIALAAWAAVEAVRAALWQPTTVVSALGQLAILVAVGVVIDGRSSASSQDLLPFALVAWIAVEAGWRFAVRALAQRHLLGYRLSRRQITVVAAACGAVLVALVVSVVVHYTTVQYYGQTVSMTSLWTDNRSPYCITYAWKVVGVNLSALGLGGPTECFDTEAELRQAASTHEWVARRGFSDEMP